MNTLKYLITLLLLTAALPPLHAEAPPPPPRQAAATIRGTDMPVFFGVVATEMPADMRAAGGKTVQANEGLCVTSVSRFSPAEDAGIRPVDIILSVGGRPVATRPDLILALNGAKPGDTLPVTILRMNRKKELSLTLTARQTAAMPEPRPAPVPRLEWDRFDDMVRQQDVIIYQLAQEKPDVERIRQCLNGIRAISGAAAGRGEASISIKDASGTIVVKGSETRILVEVHSPGEKTPQTYRIDQPGDHSILPAPIRNRFNNLQH